MIQRTFRSLVLVLWSAAVCGYCTRKSRKTITLRVLDGKTGRLVSPTGILVRANHLPTDHGDGHRKTMARRSESARGRQAFSVHATYENSMEYFVNCDGETEGQHGGQLVSRVGHSYSGHCNSERLRQAEGCGQSEGRRETGRVCSLREKAELEGRGERILGL